MLLNSCREHHRPHFPLLVVCAAIAMHYSRNSSPLATLQPLNCSTPVETCNRHAHDESLQCMATWDKVHKPGMQCAVSAVCIQAMHDIAPTVVHVLEIGSTWQHIERVSQLSLMTECQELSKMNRWMPSRYYKFDWHNKTLRSSS